MEYDSFVRERLPPPELLPEFRFDLPELKYPERLNAAAELLKGGASDALAVVNDQGRWTYAELEDFSGRIARLLVEEEGLIPGNRVLLRGPNSYTMFAAWLGVIKAGGVVVATMSLLRPGGMYVIDDLLPQSNWPEGHSDKVPVLIDDIERREEVITVRLAWASGLMLVVRRAS